MELRHRNVLSRALGCLALVALAGCGTADPEIVAIDYLRATRTAQSDRALSLLDMERIVERVQEEIVLVNTDGDPEAFLRDSVETVLWGLFQETPREEGLAYDAVPADVDGDLARVTVTMTGTDGSQQERTVELRETSAGWRVSGSSVDDLVSYVIQRLEERF